MMAQLYMEAGRYASALELLGKTMGLEACKEFPDLCAKVAACKIRCGEIAEGMAFATVLYDPAADEAGYPVYSAVDIHDLYVEVQPSSSAVSCPQQISYHPIARVRPETVGKGEETPETTIS